VRHPRRRQRRGHGPRRRRRGGRQRPGGGDGPGARCRRGGAPCGGIPGAAACRAGLSPQPRAAPGVPCAKLRRFGGPCRDGSRPGMSWLKKLVPPRIRTDSAATRKRSVPEGLWEKCERCGAVLYGPELEENLEVCPKCAFHRPIRARARLKAFLDPGELREIGAELAPTDVLRFRDQKKYADRIRAAQKATGELDALVVVEGTLKRMPMVAAAFDFAFMGGSMGSVVGERFARGAERALELGAGYVSFSASGGARMQESLFSLLQMAKTSAALG